jgi:glycosyltransferase involved in cell wall biosynthesis
MDHKQRIFKAEMISFIIPAHNEEKFLPKTLKAVHESARILGLTYELIVVNDASTDGTSEIARRLDARVINVNHRQIAATRNSGARAAHGDRLFFVDADTTVIPGAIASAIKRMNNGAVGGGALTRFEDSVPLYARLLLLWFGIFMRLASLSGGAFMFCTRKAFEVVGGFDERLFGAEDAAMSAALKKEGRFVLLWERIPTSGRRVRAVSGLSILSLLLRIAFIPSNLRNRQNVENIWYESDRTIEDAGNSVFGRVSNFLALVVMLTLITIPLWVVPWPGSLMAGTFGQIKTFAGIIVVHVGLTLWPCSLFLFRTFVQQTKCLERAKTGLLIGMALFLAIGSSIRVLDLWKSLLIPF